MSEPAQLKSGEVRVTVIDWEGKSDTVVLVDNYVVVCAGKMFVSHEQFYSNGTTILTLKRSPS